MKTAVEGYRIAPVERWRMVINHPALEAALGPIDDDDDYDDSEDDLDC